MDDYWWEIDATDERQVLDVTEWHRSKVEDEVIPELRAKASEDALLHLWVSDDVDWLGDMEREMYLTELNRIRARGKAGA